MKEIVNVSISGIAFTVDKECYAMLNNFIETTSRERGADIASEVEASIAEQILSVQPADRPVSMSLLREILERIGGVEISAAADTSSAASSRAKVTKRLYRKGEGSILGGVCNGLATYLNVHVALIRVMFLVPFILSFSFSVWRWDWHYGLNLGGLTGTMFMLYIILWIVIPKARTARQILEMEGEDITPDSLERKVLQGASIRNSSAPTVVGTVFRIIGILFGSFIMIGSVISVIAMLFSTQYAYVHNADNFTQLFSVTGLTLGWFQLWASAIIMLPSIGIFYLIVGGSFGRIRGWVAGLIFGLWMLLLIGAAVWMAFYSPELMQLQNLHIEWYDWD